MLMQARNVLFKLVQVMTITCDGTSKIGSFIIPYRAVNYYSLSERLLYLLCDVPHLMKMTRKY